MGFLASITALTTAQSQGGKRIDSNVLPPEYRQGKPYTKKWDFAWIGTAWKTRAAPYSNFRRQVDAFGKRADGDSSAVTSLVALAERERDKAHESRSPLAQFRHAYAAYMALQVDRRPGMWSKVGMAEAVDRFRMLDFPGDPEYARALFLNDSVPMPQPLRRRLGKRLLSLDPDDRRVHYVLVQNTNASLSSEERADAIRLANLFISKWPNVARGYAVRAGVYFTSFFADNKRKDDGRLAIADFRMYLSRTSVSDPFRHDIEKSINFIQTRLNRL